MALIVATLAAMTMAQYHHYAPVEQHHIPVEHHIEEHHHVSYLFISL